MFPTESAEFPTLGGAALGGPKAGAGSTWGSGNAKDKLFKRLPCSHSGTYADDCICERVQQHRCYIVATNDKDLKRRIRKIAGVPLISIKERKYQVERMPEGQFG